MIEIAPTTLTLIGVIVALGSALVSGAVVWGETKATVNALATAVAGLSASVVALTAEVKKLTTDVEVLKDRTSHRPSP